MKHLTCIILLAFLAGTGFAQPKKIAFEKYNVAEGLPEEFVISVIQDDKGFIWAATQNGLVKYDGYQFKVYKVSSDSSQTTKLQIRNLFGGLLKAKDGKIWIGGGGSTDGGTIASFNPVSEQFRHYYLPEMIHGKRRGISFMIHEDAQKNIWFDNLTEFIADSLIAFLGKINPTDSKITIYPDRLMLTSILYPIIENTEVLDSTVWMLDDQNNLKNWIPGKDNFETIIPGGKLLSDSGSPDTIRWIAKAGNNRLFLNCDHIIHVFDVQRKQVLKSYISSGDNKAGMVAGNIMAAMEDVMGHYWLMHRGGSLTRINPVTGHIQSYIVGNGELAFPGVHLSGLIAFIISHQNENGIWFQSYRSSNVGTYFLYYDFALQNFSLYNNKLLICFGQVNFFNHLIY